MSSRRADLLLTGAMLVLVAVKLWLVSAQLTGAIVPAGYDDGLFLSLAHHLIAGDWLGSYGVFTLLKPPGYPLFIAANHFTGLPLHLTQHLLYAGACGLFVWATRSCLPSGVMRLGLFALLLFQPMSASSSTLRYVRDSLYTTQVLALVACLIGLVMSFDAPLRAVRRWSAAAGLIGGFMWITRDEGVVMLPAFAAAALMISVLVWRHRLADWRARALTIGAAVPIAALFLFTVAAINARHYEYFGVSEFRSAQLNDAMGALSRVEPLRHRRWVIVARETRERIYRESAAFREIAPFLEASRDAWGAAGPLMFTWDQQLTRDERASGGWLSTVCQEDVAWDETAMRAEIMTGWFVLALREAVVAAGYTTAPRSLAHLARIADEVDAACEAGRLTCGPPRSSLAPPWRWQDAGLTLRRACRGAARLMTLVDQPFYGTYGTSAQLAVVARDTHDRLAPAADPLTPIDGSPAPAIARSPLDRWRLDALAAIYRAFVAFTPWLAGLAVVALTVAALASVASIRRASVSRAETSPTGTARACASRRCMAAVLILLLTIAPRLALVAYIDATAFPYALIALYLLPLYPLMFASFVFGAGSLAGLTEHIEIPAVRHRSR